MRTECAVLTGLDAAALGLDRFNPYFRFARRPIHSLAWSLRGVSYGTVCLHPFDPRFFGRHRVIPALGFERFLARRDFATAECYRGLVSDAALGAHILRQLWAAEQPLFVFAITVAAHGPWHDPLAWAMAILATDAMIATIAEAAARLPRPLLLVAYGDHRPALAAARASDTTDYLLWHSAGKRGHGDEQDCDAVGLHGAIRAALMQYLGRLHG